jgi:integrase/recombinase XerD
MDMKKPEDNRTGISILADEYLEGLRAIRYSERSIETYGRAIRDMIASLGKPDARLITARDLEAYRGRLLVRGFKSASVSVYFQAIRLFFRYLEERQQIFENPATGLPPIRVRDSLQPVPTEEEMRILLEQPDVTTPIGFRDRAILETMYSTGIRRQETASLRVCAVNLKEGVIRVMGKGSRERMVPLGPTAVQWLGRYLAEIRPGFAGAASVEALWLARNGTPLDGNALQAMIGRYGKAPGIVTPVRLHSIRRACATHMLRRGASPVAIQALLGHADMKHLSQYLRLSIADLQRVHAGSRVGQ